MEKLNIAEILEDCPKGMELYSPLCGKCVFDRISFGTIICTKQNNQDITFTSKGYYMLPVFDNCECMIFPSKENRDWSTFQRPFKDGDVVVDTLGGIHIMRNASTSHCYFDRLGILVKTETSCVRVDRLATEEEKQKLFDAIKANGYKWNNETKTLEKLIEPKFKVGDRVLWNYDTETPRTISKVKLASKRGYVYWIDCEGCSSGWWDETELTPIPNKFDITTLKPFDKVLVRDSNKAKWTITFFSHCNNLEIYKYSCIHNAGYAQCIPYESNEHLLDTTNDCDDFYKTWE